jgi:hypothetical protein
MIVLAAVLAACGAEGPPRTEGGIELSGFWQAGRR